MHFTAYFVMILLDFSKVWLFNMFLVAEIYYASVVVSGYPQFDLILIEITVSK